MPYDKTQMTESSKKSMGLSDLNSIGAKNREIIAMARGERLNKYGRVTGAKRKLSTTKLNGLSSLGSTPSMPDGYKRRSRND